MKCVGLIVSLCIFIICPDAGYALDRGTRPEAVAMVKRAQAYFTRHGLDKTLTEIRTNSTGQFRDRDLYVFIYDYNGTCLSIGRFHVIIGKDLYNMQDLDGKYLIQEMIQLTSSKGRGWVDYKWPNPVLKKAEFKSSYVEKMGDRYFVGVGIYTK